MHQSAGQPVAPGHGKASLLFPKHANLQNGDERNQMRSGFPRVLLVDSYVSRRFPPFHLKKRRTFALFTTAFSVKQLVNWVNLRTNQAQ